MKQEIGVETAMYNANPVDTRFIDCTNGGTVSVTGKFIAFRFLTNNDNSIIGGLTFTRNKVVNSKDASGNNVSTTTTTTLLSNSLANYDNCDFHFMLFNTVTGTAAGSYVLELIESNA